MRGILNGMNKSAAGTHINSATLPEASGGEKILSSSRNHQEAHGIGQIEEQLNRQADAAGNIQGKSKIDRDIADAANREAHTSLDEVIVRNEE